MTERRQRVTSSTGQLARGGFADAAQADRDLARLGALANVVVDTIRETADPDLALDGLSRLATAVPNRAVFDAALTSDEALRRRLLHVLGLSSALVDHLVRHPAQWADLAPEAPSTLALERGASPAEPIEGEASLAQGEVSLAQGEVSLAQGEVSLADVLRVAYRRRLLQIAAGDLAEDTDVGSVAADLSDLAAATLQAALDIARSELPPDAEPVRLAVIGMGKCGGRELNYSSDVDVVFVAEPVAGGDEAAALRTATDLATRIVRICSDHTAEGTIWPVDTALRPEGKSGPLVRTLASHRTYYERWAKTWEFQALLKARPVAGDPELGAAYLDTIAPLIWAAADRPDFVTDVQAMRRRVVRHVKPAHAEREIKLGPGGLRDVEFAVQLLQLVHGRTDKSLRSGTTLEALAALTAGGYVGRADGAQLDEAYRFLRRLEHRIQLRQLRRTHLLPEAEIELRRMGRALGYYRDPVGELATAWRKCRVEVRRLHEKLFYRPLLAAVARLPGKEARLTPEAAGERLEALGYADPAGALRHLEALTSGVSRAAAIQRTLLPVMLGWFADAPDPDAGLLGFRQVSEALGQTHWYLRLLRDEGAAAERMAKVLASSRLATELLLRAPEAVQILADDAELRPRSLDALTTEMTAIVSRHTDAESAAAAVRAIRRRELFRTVVADILGLLGVDAVGAALSDVSAATIAATVQAAIASVEGTRGGPLPTRFAVIAMGRLGGREMSYASDADVLFVHDPLPGVAEPDATDAALAVANELRRVLSSAAPDPPLLIDADLRPEGRQGPLVRTLASYRAYYGRWGEVWERQALLRAEPVAGDAKLGAEFIDLIDSLRYPGNGLSSDQVREVRRIKARVEAERLPRGADRATHLKLGPGGLSDVEWTVQLLQLRYGGSVEGLRTPRTVEALDAAVTAELLDAADRDLLLAAWRLASAVRNTVVLVRGRPSDAVPHDARELAAVSRVLGYEPGESGAFLEDYRRVTRRARSVMERVFWS